MYVLHSQHLHVPVTPVTIYSVLHSINTRSATEINHTKIHNKVLQNYVRYKSA